MMDDYFKTIDDYNSKHCGSLDCLSNENIDLASIDIEIKQEESDYYVESLTVDPSIEVSFFLILIETENPALENTVVINFNFIGKGFKFSPDL